MERGTASEEVVLCTAKGSTTFTVTRGYDGTSAVTHGIGTMVEHTVAAIDYREAVLTPMTTAERDALSGANLYGGLVISNTTTGTVETYQGTTWFALVNTVQLATKANTSHAHPTSDVTGLDTALGLKAPLASPTFTGTVAGVTKTMVGLANADNTTDVGKPVSTAQQTALDLKAPLASPSFTGTVAGVTKTMVGLGSTDNTSDSNKPVSSPQQAALDLKANIADQPGGQPIGSVLMFVGAVAPSGYLFCQGGAVSRSTYSALFAVIGTAYGSGDGSTTFTLPDMQDRFPVGVGYGHALGTSDGVAAGSSRNSLHDMGHGHAVSSSGSASGDSAGTPSGSVNVTAASAGTPTGTSSTGPTSAGTPSGSVSVGASGNSVTVQSGTGANPATGGHGHTATFSGSALGTHSHTTVFYGSPMGTHGHSATFSGSSLAGHSHTISVNTSISAGSPTRLPRQGINFIVKH